MKEQQLGVVTSLAIHAGLLVLLMSIPVANAIPYMKTICISFAQQESSPSGIKKETKAVVKPPVKKIQNISRPTVTETQPLQDEAVVKEKPVIAAGESVEIKDDSKNKNQSDLKTEITNLASVGSRRIVEARFGDTDAPTFIHQELPVYPLLARRFGKEGRVVLKLQIDKDGSLQHIEIIEPAGFGFTQAAIEAIKKSTFSPALRNGEKIVSKAILSVRFNLK